METTYTQHYTMNDSSWFTKMVNNKPVKCQIERWRTFKIGIQEETYAVTILYWMNINGEAKTGEYNYFTNKVPTEMDIMMEVLK